MRTFLHILLAALTFGAVLGYSPTAFAEDITVEVRAIEANKKGDSFDSSLDDLKGILEKTFSSYTSFEQVKKASVTLDKGEEGSIKLPEGSTLTVTFRGFASEKIKLDLSVAEKLSVSLRASPGSTFFQAGLEYGDGILILAVTVEQ